MFYHILQQTAVCIPSTYKTFYCLCDVYVRYKFIVWYSTYYVIHHPVAYTFFLRTIIITVTCPRVV